MGNGKIISLLKEIGKKVGAVSPESGETVTDIASQITDLTNIVNTLSSNVTNISTGSYKYKAYGSFNFAAMSTASLTASNNVKFSNIEGELWIIKANSNTIILPHCYGTATGSEMDNTTYETIFDISVNSQRRHIPMIKNEYVTLREDVATNAPHNVKYLILSNTKPTVTYTDTGSYITGREFKVWSSTGVV